MHSLTHHNCSDEEKEKTLSLIRDNLSCRPEIIAALVFGSFIRYPFHDIDIGLVLEHVYHPHRYYEQQLERELSDLVHYPVEIRILNNASVRFSYQVLKKGILLFCSCQKAYSFFQCRVINEFFDYSYYLNKYRREVFGLI